VITNALLILIAAAVLVGALLLAGAIANHREEAARGRSAALLAMFAPALAAAEADPRAILVWQPLADTARQIHPDVFIDLDRASGGSFPFTAERLQAAHARWSADWLAWEAAHDAEYKQKAAEAEEALARGGGSPAAKARLANIEREKLERYQQRYAEYVRVAKALQALGGA
jgi:hypothetical protein